MNIFSIWDLPLLITLVSFALGILGLSCNKRFKGMTVKQMRLLLIPLPIVMGVMIYDYLKFPEIDTLHNIITGSYMGVSSVVTGICFFLIRKNTNQKLDRGFMCFIFLLILLLTAFIAIFALYLLNASLIVKFFVFTCLELTALLCLTVSGILGMKNKN